MRTSMLAALCLLLPATAVGQFAVGGIAVDAKGMVRDATIDDRGPVVPLPRENDDVLRSSARRVVSLARLEATLARNGADPAAAVLAGLLRIEAVHLLPDDVLLVGPAEGWRVSESGDLVGHTSGTPTLRLDDLLVALRYAFTEETVEPFLGCSIDPTPEGGVRLTALERTMRRSRPGGANGDRVAAAMAEAVGPQAVRVFGVQGNTPLALGLVAADVKLKRLAMGHEPTAVDEVPSYVELLSRQRSRRGSASVRNRFWFVARYDDVHRSTDGRAYEFSGPGFGLRASAPRGVAAEDEPADRTDPAAESFVAAFDTHADELAKRHPVLAGLRGRIDLAVAAEIVVRPHLADSPNDGRRFWYPARLIDPEFRPVPTSHVPRFVPSLAGVRSTRGGGTLVHVSGGVEIDPAAIIGAAERLTDPSPPPAHPAEAAKWWWDATAE